MYARRKFVRIAVAVVACLMLVQHAIAQRTEGSSQTTSFSYQGFLNLNGTPANGNYDIQLALFDAPVGGSQLTVSSHVGVPVVNGVFTAVLDYGLQFPGAPRFFEIRVRPAGGGAYTTLLPRQLVLSTPYAMRSITAQSADSAQQATNATTATNATNLGGVPAANYLVSGAASINAGTQFNIGGSRAFSLGGTRNTFLGINSGTASPNGFATDNSFFGFNTGSVNTTGAFNTFFGSRAGQANTDGGENTFLGAEAGETNSTGDGNTFVGRSAGRVNVGGDNNTFVGATAGDANTSGSDNSFFGRAAGGANTTGVQNAFFGRLAGQSNVAGNNNTFFGFEAGKANTTNNNSFFGTQSGLVNTSGTANAFFGFGSGAENTIGSDNSFFGVNTGRGNTEGARNTFIGRVAGRFNTTGFENTYIGYNTAASSITGNNNIAIGASANVSDGLSFATVIGSGASVTSSNTVVIGRGADTVRVNGTFRAAGTAHFTNDVHINLTGSGNTNGEQVCWDTGTDRIMDCVSSIRYKTNVETIDSGLDLVKRLRPVFFDWKLSGKRSIGFIAEEVDEVEPRLATRSKTNEVRGVNYDSISAVLVSAVKEQQTQIERLEKTVSEQKVQIDELIRSICEVNPNATACPKE
jgi:hypothetical protein